MSIDTTIRPPLNAPGHHAPQPPRGSGASAARRRVGIALVSLAVVGGLVAGGAATVNYAYDKGLDAGRHLASVATGGMSEIQTATPAPPTAAEAQAKTCTALRDNYPAVSAAVDEREKYNTRPWSDPELLASVNSLVDSMSKLVVALEGSLTPQTPAQLKSAVLDYIAGLRALSISERNHATNVQLNGTGLFYNQVVDAPLKLCGIDG